MRSRSRLRRCLAILLHTMSTMRNRGTSTLWSVSVYVKPPGEHKKYQIQPRPQPDFLSDQSAVVLLPLDDQLVCEVRACRASRRHRSRPSPRPHARPYYTRARIRSHSSINHATKTNFQPSLWCWGRPQWTSQRLCVRAHVQRLRARGI